MRVQLLLVVLLAGMVLPTSLPAITMDEAVTLARENNHKVREFQNLTRAEEERVASRKTAFMPEADLGYGFSRRDNVFSFFQTKEVSVLTGEVRYNLFSGLADLRELRSEEASRDAAGYQQEAVAADVALGVKTAYIEVLRARKNRVVAEEAVELLDRQRRDTALFLREGLVAKNDLLKVEVELASSQQQLTRVRSGGRVAAARLARLVGVPIEGTEVEELGERRYPPLDRDDLKLAMFARRSELAYLRSVKLSREYARDAIRSGYFPAVDLSVTHNRYGEDPVPDGRDNLFDTETIGLVEVSWNIFDGRRKAFDARAEDREVDAVGERIADLEEELVLQLISAHEDYRVAQERLGVAAKAVEQAEENYRITENQHRHQAATTTDLLDARLLLTRARFQHNTVVYDLHEAIAELERIVEKPLN